MLILSEVSIVKASGFILIYTCTCRFMNLNLCSVSEIMIVNLWNQCSMFISTLLKKQIKVNDLFHLKLCKYIV
jgi:hypothetical protein